MIETVIAVLVGLITLVGTVVGIFKSGQEKGREEERHKRSEERMDNVHTAKQNREDTASRSDDDVRQRLREGRPSRK